MSKIKVETLKIINRVELGGGNFSFELAPFSNIKSIRPGQFLHIQIPNCGLFFRRAFSVYDINLKNKSVSILFKALGRGTSLMAALRKGDQLGIVGPLGNGFKPPSKTDNIILIGGGVGMPPLYFLAKHLLSKGFDSKKISFFYGGLTKNELVDLAKIKKLKTKIFCSTDDGSYGFKGYITQALESEIDLADQKIKIYACGPTGMLKAVDLLAEKYHFSGQLSLEAPMPCGVGICLGCILPLKTGGYTRVCREGPVYDIGEVQL
ncbi:MAG: dihydroorotate dehydrogenase electron transfer subunit [Candidatus Zixiibacteriota bacterium]